MERVIEEFNLDTIDLVTEVFVREISDEQFITAINVLLYLVKNKENKIEQITENIFQKIQESNIDKNKIKNILEPFETIDDPDDILHKLKEYKYELLCKEPESEENQIEKVRTLLEVVPYVQNDKLKSDLFNLIGDGVIAKVNDEEMVLTKKEGEVSFQSNTPGHCDIEIFGQQLFHKQLSEQELFHFRKDLSVLGDDVLSSESLETEIFEAGSFIVEIHKGKTGGTIKIKPKNVR